MEMKRCTAAILLILSLEALVDGCLAAVVGDDGVTIHLPSQSLADEIVVESGGEDASPPWKCCDLSRCTKSSPPTCTCLDKVKKCAKGCKNCEKAVGSNDASSGYYCRDTYGKVAPPCTKKTVASDVHHVSTAKADAAGERTIAGGEEDASPWKCCDLSWCTRSMPPICHCQDKVKKCDKNCKSCEKVDGSNSNGASTRYICRDTYGKVAPPCTKSVAADLRRG